MKIGLVTEYYYPHYGGITEHVHHFALEAQRLGHQVVIITSRMSGNGHPVEELDVRRIGWSAGLFSNGALGRLNVHPGVDRELRHMLDRERFDLLHIHNPVSPTLPIIAQKAARCPTVATIHSNFNGYWAYRAFRGIVQGYLDRLDGLIVVSESCRQIWKRAFDVDPVVIPNGVDIRQFSPERPRPTDRPPTVMFIGRLDLRNGLDTLLEAMPLVRRAVPQARLVVVGDGPYLPYYAGMVPRDLRDAISFPGAMNGGRPSYYAGCDVVCCPARIASFGITLLEGMASGKPLVASDIDGFHDLVTQGQEGVLVPPNDPAGFAEALVSLLRDARCREEMGRAGRQKAERYAWPIVARRILDFYQQVLSRTGSRASAG